MYQCQPIRCSCSVLMTCRLATATLYLITLTTPPHLNTRRAMHPQKNARYMLADVSLPIKALH